MEPPTIDTAESVADNEDVSDVSDDNVTLRLPSMPSIQIQARLDLPAWFVVLTAYTFAYGLGFFARYSQYKSASEMMHPL